MMSVFICLITEEECKKSNDYATAIGKCSDVDLLNGEKIINRYWECFGNGTVVCREPIADCSACDGMVKISDLSNSYDLISSRVGSCFTNDLKEKCTHGITLQGEIKESSQDPCDKMYKAGRVRAPQTWTPGYRGTFPNYLN